MVTVFIGLGSNMQEPREQLLAAKRALQSHPHIQVQACSDLYQSRAMTLENSAAQDDYLNAVMQLQTDLSADALLDELQTIENQQGRVRTARWAARTLDLDILLYDQQQIHTARLDIPHPGICERNFVLFPLRQIAPNCIVPAHGTATELAAAVTAEGIRNAGLFA